MARSSLAKLFATGCTVAVFILLTSGCKSKSESGGGGKTVLPPPTTPGCYQLKPSGHQWDQVACLSQRAASRLPHPTIGGSSGAYGLSGPCVGTCGTVPAGLISAGEVAVSFPFSTAGLYSMVDSGTGRDSFSIQVNTNDFTINCQPGSSNCVQGDTGAVQFTYQGDPGPWFNPFGWLSQSALCVWTVDVTTQNYHNACTGIPSPFGGSWTPGGVAEIVGGESAGILWVMGCVPWASSTVQCFSTATQDPFGLCVNPAASQCAWQQVSGSLLGMGNSSTANFPAGVTMATTTAGVSCFPPPTYPIPFHPFPPPGMGFSPATPLSFPVCPLPTTLNYATGPVLSGFGTQETNNLNPEFAPASANIAACIDGMCWIQYTASD